MTSPEKPSAPEIGSDRSADSHRIAIASKPMSDDQLKEFASSLQEGWEFERPALPIAHQQAGNSATGNGGQPKESDPHTALVDEIYVWLSETLDDYFHLSPRDHAAKALCEFRDPPCAVEELLSFFKAFAYAYERLLLVQVEVASDILKSGNVLTGGSDENQDAGETMALASAQSYPDRFEFWLKRLHALAGKSPEAAELFRLVEFAGCNAKEMALYLGLPEDTVARRIENRRHLIFTSTSDI